MDELRGWLERNKVPEIVSIMLEGVCADRPGDVVAYMIRFLQNMRGDKDWPGLHVNTDGNDESSSSGDEQPAHVVIDDHKSEQIRRRYSMTNRRSGVSSEVIANTSCPIESPYDWPTSDPTNIANSNEVRSRIEKCLSNNILFTSLEKEAMDVVMGNMFERECVAGEIIIRQYDPADNFYLIEAGICNVIVQPSPESEGKLATTLGPDSCFGELALMYGTPRAATVQAATDVKLWCLDRDTYRRILWKAMYEKRKKYEEFLKKVPILETLTDYERMTVADALQQSNYAAGDIIVQEGQPGNTFYMIVTGDVVVTQQRGDTPTELTKLHSGDFFGEVALMLNQPRVATVTAMTDVTCVKLDRKSFKRLLGPIQEILKRNMTTYSLYIKDKI